MNGASISFKATEFTVHFNSKLRWPRELNALQLQKTHANRKSTSKSRKHLHHFGSRWCKCSQHKQIKKHCKCSQHKQIHFICSAFLFRLCCEHLQRVCCQIDESVFLICRCFFYLQRVELSWPPYKIHRPVHSKT